MKWYECNKASELQAIGKFREVKALIAKDLNGKIHITAKSWGELHEKIDILKRIFDTSKKDINLAEHYKIKNESASSDGYFLNEKLRLAFFIKKHEKGFFDEELGIKKKHYLDKHAAKEWKNKLLKEFHPDKNIKNDHLLNYDEITSCINKIYTRMVGKA